MGLLVAEKMTPATVELALEIRTEIEARYEEADQLRCRAIERAQGRGRPCAASLHDGRSGQPARRRHTRVGLEREASRAGEGPRRTRARASQGSGRPIAARPCRSRARAWAPPWCIRGPTMRRPASKMERFGAPCAEAVHWTSPARAARCTTSMSGSARSSTSTTTVPRTPR